MGKAASDGMLDSFLDKLATCDSYSICSAEPANQAGIAAITLATVAITGGDFSKANGDTSGRKTTVSQQSSMSITSSGTASHVVIDDGTDIHVTTCTSIVLTSGGTVTGPAYDVEIADPT